VFRDQQLCLFVCAIAVVHGRGLKSPSYRSIMEINLIWINVIIVILHHTCPPLTAKGMCGVRRGQVFIVNLLLF